MDRLDFGHGRDSTSTGSGAAAKDGAKEWRSRAGHDYKENFFHGSRV